MASGSRVDRVLHAAHGRALRLHALDAGRRGLPGRQAVDLVVHDDVGQVDVAPHRVHEVVAADAVAVAVAAGDDDLHLVVGQGRSGRYRQRAAVQGVHTVGVDVAGQVRRAADAADRHDLVGLQAELGDCLLQRGEHTEVAAAGTPVRIDLPLQILDGHHRASRQLLRGALASRRERTLICSPPYTMTSWTGTNGLAAPARTAFTPATMWCGMNGSPSYLRMWPSATMLVSERR